MKRIFIKSALAAAMISGFGLQMAAQEAYSREMYLSQAGDTLRYRMLAPEQIEPGQVYPLVLFLHGSGERGADNEAQLTHGSQMWLNPVNRLDHPAFVLFPQCPEDAYWAYVVRPGSFEAYEMPDTQGPTPMVLALKELVEEFAARPDVDSRRIYVVGLSMGGMATFDLAVRYPDLFAAAVPICGSVNPERLAKAKDVKFRIYHGDADPVVPVEASRQAYRALRSAGAEVVYVEFPGVGHGSWNPAFSDPEFISWLFSQIKD